MPSWSLSWSAPRTWFVTARLLEGAAVVGVVGAVLQSWIFFETTHQAFGDNGEPLPDGPPFLDRVATFAIGGFGFGFGQAPVMTIVVCLLLLAVLAVLHFAQPVSNPGVLRWETFALWLGTALLTTGLLLSIVVGLVMGDPNEPPEGVVMFSPGPGVVTQLLSNAAAPMVCFLLLGTVALWWLKLPAEFPELEGEEPVKPHRTSAAAVEAGADDILLDGVELIEPVERLQPRKGSLGDGSTPSGYDDYFRRT